MGRGLERRHLTHSGDRDDDRPRVFLEAVSRHSCLNHGTVAGFFLLVLVSHVVGHVVDEVRAIAGQNRKTGFASFLAP